MTSVVLKPSMEARRRQQDLCSADSCASTGLMHFSNGHVNTSIATKHFPASHVAHSYTPIVQLGHLLMSIKEDVQEAGGERHGGTRRRTGRRERHSGTRRRTGRRETHGRMSRRTAKGQEKTSRAGPSLSLVLALSLSLSRNACNPYYEHPGAG
jgi:hypothetical protein